MNNMTWQDYVENYLKDRGVYFEAHLKGMMEYIKNDPSMEGMKNRWNHPVEDVNPMKAMLRLIAKRKALEWIDENLPNAFFRPLFSGEIE